MTQCRGPRLSPPEVIANQLQCSRIPGTTEFLGMRHDGAILRMWADGVVTMLGAYGYKIIDGEPPADAKP